MLKVGDAIPDFSAPASTGGSLSKADLAGKPFILFFYPKSFTSGCTIETRHFALLAPQIRELGAQVVGISIDPLEKQCKFATETGADFPILADPDAVITKKFDLKRMLLPVAKRVTYLVDEKGFIEAIFASERGFKEHGDNVLKSLSARSRV